VVEIKMLIKVKWYTKRHKNAENSDLEFSADKFKPD